MTLTIDIPGLTDSVTIVDRAEQHRYELHVGDAVRGLAVYCDSDDVRAIVHTEIDEELQGRGLAGHLAHRALTDIAANGLRVEPACPYIAWYIEQHPEYGSLVAR